MSKAIPILALLALIASFGSAALTSSRMLVLARYYWARRNRPGTNRGTAIITASFATILVVGQVLVVLLIGVAAGWWSL